jgi:hypothetical protein
MASYGYCVPERLGKTFRHDIRPTKHAIAAFNNGSKKAFFDALPKRWPKTCTNAAALTFAKHSLTAASFRQK